MFMEHNHEIPTNDCTEEELKEPQSNELLKPSAKNTNIYKEEKKENTKKNQIEINISIPIGKINFDYRIKILRKKYVNQKNHKKIKNKAFNQYKPPNNKFLNNPFVPNITYSGYSIPNPYFGGPVIKNNNNNFNNNIQGPNQYFNNNMNNFQYGQQKQFVNNNNQIMGNNFTNNRNNNNGFNNGNTNFNNFNQNNMNNFNNINPLLLQQFLCAIGSGNNNANEYLMKMLNDINKANNMQNQNNGINLNLLPFLNTNNPEEICIIKTIRENTEKGQKIYKVKYSTSLVQNNNKNRKFQK
jgi:hypothetical protein